MKQIKILNGDNITAELAIVLRYLVKKNDGVISLPTMEEMLNYEDMTAEDTLEKQAIKDEKGNIIGNQLLLVKIEL